MFLIRTITSISKYNILITLFVSSNFFSLFLNSFNSGWVIGLLSILVCLLLFSTSPFLCISLVVLHVESYQITHFCAAGKNGFSFCSSFLNDWEDFKRSKSHWINNVQFARHLQFIFCGLNQETGHQLMRCQFQSVLR